MTNRGWKDNSDNWTVAADWSPAGVPRSVDDVAIRSGAPQITTDVGSVHSLGVASELDVDATGFLSSATYLYNIGSIFLDAKSGAGGATVRVGGNLVNNGLLQIGSSDGTQSGSTYVVARSLIGAGTFDLFGGATSQAALVISDKAGFGTAGALMARST